LDLSDGTLAEIRDVSASSLALLGVAECDDDDLEDRVDDVSDSAELASLRDCEYGREVTDLGLCLLDT